MPTKEKIKVVVNGHPVETEDQVALPSFLRDQDLDPERVVVEYNGRAQTRKESAETHLSEGDQLEVVRIVAGG